MIRPLILAAVLFATPAMAECAGMWMPILAHQVLPPHMGVGHPVYRLVPSDRIVEWCASFLDARPPQGQWIHACNGWRDGVWYIGLRSDISSEQQWCDVRHEFGHEWDREMTGNPNYWHGGWVRGL